MQKTIYNADNILLLDGIDHIRTRPSMYIGDVGIRGLHHLIYELIDNSIDEALAGFCNKISLIIKNNDTIVVFDNGRGIPIDLHKQEKKSALEVVMTKVGSGGKFDKNSYKISGGLHGVGLSCVNALSIKLIAKIYKNGKIYTQEYSKGRAVNQLKCIGNTKLNGTEIQFQADNSIFKTIHYDYDNISSRLRELSFLNKGISITLIDKRLKINGNYKNETFYSSIGLKEFINFIDSNRDSINKDIIYVEEKYNDVSVELAMKYNNSFSENIYSYVNNIHTNEGGTHVTGFRKALTRTFKKYSYDFNKKNKFKINISSEDFREGLTVIISIKLVEPQFEGQTKTKLGNNEVIGIIDRIVNNMLTNYLEENPLDAKKILEKIFLSAKSRQAAKKARELIQHKNFINNINVLPIKLSDCSYSNPLLCEIYLVEGDSAGGTAKQGRDRNFQAILPLRGKILNVEKSIQNKVFENDEIKSIFTALGVFIGTDKDSKELNISKLRYNKIIIMTDADVDGSHISTLILTFFFRYMKSLIEKGFIYIASPPLFSIKKFNSNKYIYAWSEKEKDNIIKQFNSNKKLSIQRYKGLGEMNSDQLWETTMNPENRILKQIKIENIIESDRIFSMLMGENVPPRKKFIEENALYANIDT